LIEETLGQRLTTEPLKLPRGLILEALFSETNWFCVARISYPIFDSTNYRSQIFMHYAMNRLSIFVDGNNMFYAQQKNGWFFDPKRVLEYFVSERDIELVNAFWYTGLKDPQDQRGFRDALISLGYTVRTKILKEYYDDTSGRYSQKANLDIEIVVDMFNTVDQYDRVILFSGDGDFERAIELLRSKSTHITVVSTEGMIARELRNVTDRYIDLNDLRPHIEKADY
jgi:uncharacterized LabA/DUF88 family protein